MEVIMGNEAANEGVPDVLIGLLDVGEEELRYIAIFVLYLYITLQALSFMLKIDEFCTLCFQIIHVLSFRPNPVNFFC
ncbi:hypothetical protein Hanom_Chr12g01139881 [Helianthus anomalus]